MELVFTLTIALVVFFVGYWAGYLMNVENYVNQLKAAEKRCDEWQKNSEEWKKLTLEAVDKAGYFYGLCLKYEKLLGDDFVIKDDEDPEDIVWN